jgi:hypothetical protein
MMAVKEGFMYRLALLAWLFLAVFALAQQPVSTPTNSQQMPAAVSQDLMQAPQPGHSLDPHDVDVLTGKDKEPQTPYGTGSTYLMYGSGTAYGYGYGRGSAVPLLAGDILPRSRDLSVPRLPFFGVVPRPFVTPFGPRSLAGSIRRFPLFGTHRPAFGFRF